jgi:hypothetical protein
MFIACIGYVSYGAAASSSSSSSSSSSVAPT